MIEKHFTLDKSLPGPDHTISVNPEEMLKLSTEISQGFGMLGEKNKNALPEEVKGRFYGRRSTYSAKGHILTLRPALHINDSTILDSWDAKIISGKNNVYPDGPIRLKNIH